VSTQAQPSEAEIDELVSHVLALRKDFVQDLLRAAGVPFSGLRKAELRERLREAIDEGAIDPADVAGFLDDVEPGGKQHVFVLRASRAVNDKWKDRAVVRRRLQRRADVRDLLGAAVPLLMPAELTLSRVGLDGPIIEIVGVEARRYTERDEFYDERGETDEGLPVELRAYVQRVARSTVVLRWNTATRHAGLHITQASGRGLETDHYSAVAARFAQAVTPWLDLNEFKRVNLPRALHALHQRERSGEKVLTHSRAGRWETEDGSELAATGASSEASFFADRQLDAAVGAVQTPASGLTGNVYWLPTPGGPVSERLHLSILAWDSRIHFMVPSSHQAVEHVLEQVRSLL
jgi:hypothetical protein